MMSTATLNTLERSEPALVQLVRGSIPDSGGGCAMNALSVYNQDFKVTDYPGSTAPPLARLVQLINDEAADAAGVLSAADSDAVLLLAAATHGTSASEATVVHAWLAEMLVNEQWGVTASLEAGDQRVRRLCRALAGCLRTRARGATVSPLRLMRLERLSHNLIGVPKPVKEVIGNARLVVRSESGWAAVFAAENAAAEARKISRIEPRRYTQLGICAWRELSGPTLCAPPSLHDLRAAAAWLNARPGR